MIPHKIIKKEDIVLIKLSLDVEVDIINGSLPNEQELGELSDYLISKEKNHNVSFVCFYLPGMELDSGAYATAHHNPKMNVEIMEFMLCDYPQYQNFLDI